MYFVNAYFGMSSSTHGGLSVSLMSYTSKTDAELLNGTKEITTFTNTFTKMVTT